MPMEARMTVARFERVAPQLGPCELVRGAVVSREFATVRHATLAANVTFTLHRWERRRRKGRVFCSSLGIVTAERPGTVRGADVAYISYKRLPRGPVPEGFSRIPPELVVEVVGKGQGWDVMVEKAGEYLAMGVDRVWVVDLAKQTVHVFRPDGEPLKYGAKSTLTDADVLLGFRVRMRSLFD